MRGTPTRRAFGRKLDVLTKQLEEAIAEFINDRSIEITRLRGKK
jgi:hypothetical protein